MDRGEMHILFRSKFNKINTNKNKAVLPEEIDLYLNDAMDKFVDLVTSPKGNYKEEGFEETQRRLDDIRTIIRTDSTNPSSPVHTLSLTPFDRGVYVVLPNDYKKLVNNHSDTSFKCGAGDRVRNRLYSSEIIGSVLNDMYYTTKPLSPVSELIDNKLYVYNHSNEFTITNVYITYIYKYPKISSSNGCMLPDDTHRRIVDMAVTEALSVINAANYEKSVNQISKNE